MAAGMHLSRVLRSILRFIHFLNGQRIHIRPKSQGLLRTKIEEGTQGAVQGRKHPAAKAGQGIFQIIDSFRQPHIQLRDPVQCPAVSYNLHRPRLQSICLWVIILQFRFSVNFSLVIRGKR